MAITHDLVRLCRIDTALPSPHSSGFVSRPCPPPLRPLDSAQAHGLQDARTVIRLPRASVPPFVVVGSRWVNSCPAGTFRPINQVHVFVKQHDLVVVGDPRIAFTAHALETGGPSKRTTLLYELMAAVRAFKSEINVVQLTRERHFHTRYTLTQELAKTDASPRSVANPSRRPKLGSYHVPK